MNHRFISIGFLALGLIAVFMGAVPAMADWYVGDGHKMHYPQLPKVNGGWDVMSQYYVSVADDWQCSESGPVLDVHTWVSFKDDALFTPETYHLAIWADDPAGDTGIPGEDPNNDYSKPRWVGDDGWLWHGDTTNDMVYWGSGDQGWFDPRFPENNVPSTLPDHQEVY